MEAPEADAENHGHVVGVGLGDFKAGVLQQHLGRSHGELGEAVHAPHLFGRHVVLGHEVFYFAGDTRIIGRSVEQGDGRDARLAGKQAFPGGFNVVGEGRNAGYAGDHYAGTGHADSFWAGGRNPPRSTDDYRPGDAPCEERRETASSPAACPSERQAARRMRNGHARSGRGPLRKGTAAGP